MPTYDYICEDCEQEFEQFQAITAKPIRKCPNCGKLSLKRLIGAGSGLIFKGNGFYETDYRSESYKKAEKSEKVTTDKDTAEKKTDTKTKDSKTVGKGKADTKDKKKSA
ncbi:MAG: FmdB family zinc ribbon protein [Planctomycetota bacterium]|jgi:putative FmdB family regulatory protein